MTDAGSGRVADLPPSAKYVLYALREADGELTRGELLEETDLPERTLDEALDTLENREYLLRARQSHDARVVVCKIRGSRRC